MERQRFLGTKHLLLAAGIVASGLSAENGQLEVPPMYLVRSETVLFDRGPQPPEQLNKISREVLNSKVGVEVNNLAQNIFLAVDRPDNKQNKQTIKDPFYSPTGEKFFYQFRYEPTAHDIVNISINLGSNAEGEADVSNVKRLSITTDSGKENTSQTIDFKNETGWWEISSLHEDKSGTSVWSTESVFSTKPIGSELQLTKLSAHYLITSADAMINHALYS